MTRQRVAGGMIAGLLLLAATAAGAAPRECPTWFPDFANCGREGRFEGFTAPVTDPYLFEDPFITTGAQFYAIWHEFPKNSALGDGLFGGHNGGHLWLIALQLRLALTDRLAFIASKDGYGWQRPANPLLLNSDGFYDLGLGLKYALIQDREKNFILSPILRFDVPSGQNQMFQGNGNGVIQPGFSMAWGLEKFHSILNFGFRVPFSTNKESTSLFYNLHLDYRIWKYFAPFVEFNGYSWISGGDGTNRIKTVVGTLTFNQVQAALGPLGLKRFEGVDVANLGYKGVGGDNYMTFAVGARIPITRNLSLGAAWEFPMTARDMITDQRVTMSALLEF